jgi:hypothetical protein
MTFLKLLIGRKSTGDSNKKSAEEIREQIFIENINNLETLEVTSSGGMSIDPDSIRERVIQARKELKGLVANN